MLVTTDFVVADGDGKRYKLGGGKERRGTKQPKLNSEFDFFVFDFDVSN